jgi:hypothetical protein
MYNKPLLDCMNSFFYTGMIFGSSCFSSSWWKRQEISKSVIHTRWSCGITIVCPSTSSISQYQETPPVLQLETSTQTKTSNLPWFYCLVEISLLQEGSEVSVHLNNRCWKWEVIQQSLCACDLCVSRDCITLTTTFLQPVVLCCNRKQVHHEKKICLLTSTSESSCTKNNMEFHMRSSCKILVLFLFLFVLKAWDKERSYMFLEHLFLLPMTPGLDTVQVYVRDTTISSSDTDSSLWFCPRCMQWT